MLLLRVFLRSTNRRKDGKDHRYFSIVERGLGFEVLSAKSPVGVSVTHGNEKHFGHGA
jgi:hypothetical protein